MAVRGTQVLRPSRKQMDCKIIVQTKSPTKPTALWREHKFGAAGQTVKYPTKRSALWREIHFGRVGLHSKKYFVVGFFIESSCLGQASLSLGGASNANKPASSWPLKQGPKKWSKHGCDKGTLTVATGLGTHKEKKVSVDIQVQAAGSQICLHNMCGQQRNSPMADPFLGPNMDPFGVQNWITF